MRLLYWTSFLLVAFMTMTACKSTKKTSEQNQHPKESAQQMTLYDKQFKDLQTDNYDIDSISIENQTLIVLVSYGGGCGDADFEMYYQPQMLTVMPHRGNLFLKLKDDDPCRSIVSKKLAFDLSVFTKEAKAGGIILNLNGQEFTYRISDE